MNNDMEIYSSTKSHEAAEEDMRNALRLIAKEILRFRLDFEAGKNKVYKNNEDTEVLKKEISYSAKLCKKNKQLKKLKENLNTICNVAKIILSAKNRETGTLNEMRNESLDIRKRNAQNLSLIQRLRIENYNINNDVQLLYNFIHLAYEKLQKMRNDTPKHIPLIEQLKAILLACGQYYAESSDARDRCAQLERKNRFLKNKLNIVENNLAATMEELRNLRSQNTKLRVKCELYHKNRETFFNKLIDDGIKRHCNNADLPTTIQNKHAQEIPNRSLYVTSHLETVRNLILDQDNMLEELKELYLEVLTPEL